MPAKAAGPDIERYRFIRGMFTQQRARQGAMPRAEAAVGFLQRHHISVQFAQHIEDTLRPAPPIRADRLADIVTRDKDHALRNLPAMAL